MQCTCPCAFQLLLQSRAELSCFSCPAPSPRDCLCLVVSSLTDFVTSLL